MARGAEGFQEPPWVFGDPSESYRWAVFSASAERHHGRKREQALLQNVVIKVDLETTGGIEWEGGSLHELLGSLLGFAKVREDFEPLLVAEAVLRGLRRARFMNVAKVDLDGDVVYEHPEKMKDLQAVVELLEQESKDREGCSSVAMDVWSHSHPPCKAHVTVQNSHGKRKHSIEIRIDGNVEESSIQSIVAYLKRNLPVGELVIA